MFTMLRPRYGLTLVELLVVMGIIGLLAALAIPAVEQARDSARRARCAGNLRQIGLATQGYVAQYQVFPPLVGPDDPPRPKSKNVFRSYSVFTRILGGLDQGPLYNAINFQVGLTDFLLLPLDSRGVGHEANVTVMRANLQSFVCPADVQSDLGWTGPVNYRANLGTERWWVPMDSPFMDGMRPLPPSATTDGLSNTAAFGEKLHGRMTEAQLDPRRGFILGGAGLPFTVEESLSRCAGNPPRGFRMRTGLSWFIGLTGQTGYNHVIEPNSRMPDCFLPSGAMASGFAALRSNHPGGVNAALADGSVRFVRTGIDRRVWRSLGTRSGSEAVPAAW